MCRTEFDVASTTAKYLVVDLTAAEGVDAVSGLDEVPQGGWTDEYKTSKMVFRRIEPGEFMMCNRAKVKISKPYYIGVFEVTQRQYELVMGDSAMQGKLHYDKDKRWPTHPMQDVCYNEVRGAVKGSLWPRSAEVDEESFVGRLRRRFGVAGFDLPTEAQWEYACRAGTTSAYNNGGNRVEDLMKLGRFGGNMVGDPTIKERGTKAAGSYLPNAWGLYDMHGNVFEWCLDWQWRLVDSTDPKGAERGMNRCLRGGSLCYRADECTSHFRYYSFGRPDNASGFFGFRMAFKQF